MTTPIPSNINNLVSNTSDLGKALMALFESGGNGTPCSMNITELLKIAESMNIDSMIGTIKILSILGIIVIDNNGFVRTTGKYARFALGSLSKFLICSLPVVTQPDIDADEERYMTQITSALETVRRNKIGISPIYFVDIVNVIIKGKQIRKYREKEVYLHIYHPDWEAYHLIGLGKRVERSLEELAHRALEVKLKLQPHQYAFEPSLNPDTVSYTDISGSHGAITKYTINAKVIKSFELDLNSHLKKLIENPNNNIHEATFRWFTIEEIIRGISDDQERIMPSTPLLMQTLDLKFVREAAGKVAHMQKRVKIGEELSNRLNLKNAILYGGIGIFVLLLAIYSDGVIKFFSEYIPALENLSNLFQIISYIGAFVLFFVGYNKST